MTLWDQLIGWLPSRILEEATLGNIQLLKVSERKQLGRKIDNQGSKESSAPDSSIRSRIIGKLPKTDSWILASTGTEIRKYVDELALLTLFSAFLLAAKKRKTKQWTYTTHPALEFALASQFTKNCESQKFSHEWNFQGNTRKKINAREFKISLHLTFKSYLKMTLWDQLIGCLPSRRLEEATLGNLQFLIYR